jgi:putative membrane protein
MKPPTYARPLAVAAVLTTVLIGTGAASAATSMADTGATAPSSGVKVSNTESVQVYVDPDGKLGMQHIYEQLTLAGHGTVDLTNPITTTGLRNLNGFSGVTVKDGNQVVDTSVDGKKQLRTVSDYRGKLPIKLTIAYKLDGKPVKASDIVGKSGHLDVTYTVENTTGMPTKLSFDDGKGGTVTKTVDVPIPLVGSLSTTAPENFDNVMSKQASMGGDGHGGTQMQFTMTLLPPVGPASSTFGYSADITDGVIPRAELQVLPVDPLASPTFSSAAASYKGGADTGVQLTDGALQMDDGLMRLRGGASDLVAGLIKLHDGAGQLSSGLKDTAVPGATKLADGTTQLDDGGKKLADGAGQLSDGLQQLKSKAPQLADGVQQIYDGQKALADGLTQLYDGVTDPAKKQQIEQLISWADTVKSDIGSTATAGDNGATIFGTLVKIEEDLAQLDASDPHVSDALALAEKWVKKTDSGYTGQLTTDSVDALLVSIGTQTVKSSLQQIADGLGAPTAGCDPTKTLRCGAAALVDGGAQLNAAVPQLRSGVDQLAAGGLQLKDGSAKLSDGLGQANDGAHQLATGLGTAADGAGQIDDGLGQASDGAPQIVDGAKQLDNKGAKKIAAAGQDTAQSYGEMYAELVAEGKRARDDSMAVGAPQGASALTAYQFIVTGDDGQDSRNADRGMLAGGLLIATGGGLLLRRRFAR